MKRLEKVYGYSFGQHLEMVVYRIFPNRGRRYEIEANGVVVARMDTEEKARLATHMFVEGWEARGKKNEIHHS